MAETSEEVKIEVDDENTETASAEEKESNLPMSETEELSAVHHKSLRSYSQQWSEYESVEEEDKALEEIRSDPKKEILWAAERNEMETLRKLLEEDSSLVNAQDADHYTPLHRACYSNNTEVIKVLLSYDADISAKTIDGWQPLHCACKWDSVEAASLLLQNGADVNALTKGNLTPLYLAASNPSGRRTLELLLWHPYIDASIKNDGNDLPYDAAYRSGPLSTLFEILDESINVY